jgi:SSS family transporter
MRISGLDLAVILLYLAGITIFGIRFRKGQQDLRDYFLGGRKTPWWALAFSIVATETSTLTVIGTPALAFAGDLGFLQLVLGYQVARVIICLLFIPQYFRGEFFTAYQLIEKRFGERMRRVAAGTFLVTRTLAEGVRVAAVGLVVGVAFGTGEVVSVALITLLTLVYTFHGGLSAVIWTDVIQLGIYVSGAVAALVLLLGQIPGGWAEVVQVATAHGNKLRVFDFTLNLTTTYTFWSGVIGGMFLTMASHGTDQLMVQRLLAARHARDSRLALLVSGVIVFAQFALFLLLGTALFAYHGAPEIAAGKSYDRVFPEFIVAHMPSGWAGLMIAAVFAAAMSTTSGTLSALASSSVVDFLGVGRGAANEQGRFLRLSRWMTLAWGAVLLALGTLHWGPLLQAGLQIFSITAGALLGLFLLGTLNARAREAGALAGMAAGIITMLLVKFFTPVAWTWYVLIGTTATFAVGSAWSEVAEFSRPKKGKG